MKAGKKPQLNISIAFSATETLFFFVQIFGGHLDRQLAKHHKTDGRTDLRLRLKLLGNKKLTA